MSPSEKQLEQLVLMAQIVKAWGVRGTLKIRHFAAKAEDLMQLPLIGMPVPAQAISQLTLHCYKITEQQPGFALIHLREITTREEAEAIVGHELYMQRSQFPALGVDEFYCNDIIGMTAVEENANPIGIITRIVNFGSCDLLEITTANKSEEYYPIAPGTIIDIDYQNKTLVLKQLDAI